MFMVGVRNAGKLQSTSIRVFDVVEQAIEYGKDKPSFMYQGFIWELFTNRKPKLIYSFYKKKFMKKNHV